MTPLCSKTMILFDMDGTITDSAEGITNSVKYMLESFGLNNYDEALLRRFIGPPLKESMIRIFGFDEAKAHVAVMKYREYFGEYGIYENKLYDGIADLLSDLGDAGKTVMLATSKTEMFMHKVLDHFGIARYFDITAGSLYDGSRIRKGEVVRHALELAWKRKDICKPENTGAGSVLENPDSKITAMTFPQGFLDNAVMVGDREQDITGARENGIDSVGVLYGYGSRGELKKAGATYIVRTIGELRDSLLGRSR